jgi:dTDP-4-amino-4,6-dideoxy-D-galactose acyltransferase
MGTLDMLTGMNCFTKSISQSGFNMHLKKSGSSFDVESTLIRDAWLCKIMKRHVYRIAADQVTAEVFKVIPSLLRETAAHEKVFIYTKTSVDDFGKCELLLLNGFRLIDGQVTFEKPNEPSISTPVSSVRPAVLSDENNVCKLARQSFSFSRFHRDPVIGKTLASKIKEAWARSYFNGTRGCSMLVSDHEQKKVRGFLLLLADADARLIIDLIAVDQAYRGQALGATLIDVALGIFPEKRCVRVGTQLSNSESIRFYERIGFRFFEANNIYHYHGIGEKQSSKLVPWKQART